MADILYLIGSLDIGGAELQLYHLARKMHTTGYTCHLFVLQSVGPMKPYYQDAGIKIFSGGLKAGELPQAPWKIIPAFMKLMQCVLAVRPKIIHAFLPLMTFIGAIAGRVCNVEGIISSKRALGTHQERYPFLRILDIVANRLSHRVTANSVAVLEDVTKRERLSKSKISVIHNGIETGRFTNSVDDRESEKIRKQLGIGDQETVVICVANLIPYKGHLDLLNAAKIISDNRLSAKYLLVGEDRGCLAKLSTVAKRLSLEDVIIFTGQREDIPKLLRASDISVLASHEEGFSNVILESMVCGLPMVATDVGGNREAVLHGKTGWLVEKNSPRALAEKIMDLMQSPAKSKAWGALGRQHVENKFAMKKMVQSHVILYRCLIKNSFGN